MLLRNVTEKHRVLQYDLWQAELTFILTRSRKNKMLQKPNHNKVGDTQTL